MINNLASLKIINKLEIIIKMDQRTSQIIIANFFVSKNLKNLNGQSPLFFVKTLEDVSLLLKYGALITIVDVSCKKAYDTNPIVKQFMKDIESKFNRS